MYWLRRLFRKEKTEKQLDSELRFHIEQLTADYVNSGMSRAEAERRAKIEFGGIEGVKEECRESRRVHTIETLLQDIRYGLRIMRRSPGFTAVAILTLTLGIGANTAIFSVVNGVLLSPLPYPHPEQLITLHESKPNFQYGSISYPNFRDWQKENRTFSAIALTRGSSFILTGAGEAEQEEAELISADLLPILGVKPQLGRNLLPGEDEIGAAPVVLISAGLWHRKFRSAPDILGKGITLDGKAYNVIGVMPENFRLPTNVLRAIDLYVPIAQWGNPLLTNRGAGLGFHGIGRLKPGASLEQARADMDHVAKNLEAAYPVLNKGIGASLIPLRQVMLGKIQPLLLLLLGAVGFVLLIACVNVANLLLARSTSRTREFGVRIALGAGVGRIVRQLLTESILLGLIGGGLGLALATWGMPVILKALPGTLPRADEIKLDGLVLVFTILASLFAGLLFGVVPAWKISRPDVLARMKQGGPNVSRKNYRTQNTLVVVELAMALILLVGAGLMVRSLTALWRTDAGFNPRNLLTFSLALPPSMANATPDALRAVYRQMEDKLASVPGVEANALTWGAFPLVGDDERLFWMEGQPRPASPNDMKWALQYVVSPGYLRSMGTPLLHGRFFTAADDERAPLVAVVDEAFAEKFFPGQDPVGKRINLDNARGPTKLAEIVGVVKHVKQWGLDNADTENLQAQLYTPFMQLPDSGMMLAGPGTGLVLRARGTMDGLLSAIRKDLQEMNAEMVVYGAISMNEIISTTLASRRFSMVLLTSFAALALILASIGIYGVISYVVGQRTQEIGIRMALGARGVHVAGMVLGQGTRLVLGGVGIGVVAALALTRLMTSLLYGVSRTDPLTFISVATLLTLVALLACIVPVYRAMRIDPIVALRCE
ncbi:MAG TPA: ABC transporter permease [Candidatus Angelobacter sp.]